jgi:putative ABC transport system ATP-binding protein
MTATLTAPSDLGPRPSDLSKDAPPLLVLRDVEKTYRTEHVEKTTPSGVGLDRQDGEFVAVMGPSGSGKSTLLNLMGLLDTPTRGTVMIDRQSVRAVGDAYLARLRNTYVGFVFQQFHLIPDLPVLDNVMLPLLYRKMGGAERKQRAKAMLDRVGLSARTDHYPGQLSGGQQQRVAIARALVHEPKLLLADEPTGNLDSAMGDEIMDLLAGLNREGVTIVMVTHDPRLAERTHRIVRLHDGRRVA